jgi:hypothetical protein
VHVIVATDGSRQSLAAARHLMSFSDPVKITTISVVAVIRPLASVAFADEISSAEQRVASAETGSFGRRRKMPSTRWRPSSTAGGRR